MCRTEDLQSCLSVFLKLWIIHHFWTLLHYTAQMDVKKREDSYSMHGFIFQTCCASVVGIVCTRSAVFALHTSVISHSAGNQKGGVIKGDALIVCRTHVHR
ncbi:hypothetical protein ATANTOWER_032119 [Ataeniobius toweri]|uniref:Secreted protein n=1 Tax=Ataeniobius toweri TaxID=208326 RepID=A0ABU7ACB9_9TELE|nr:hypothetical protein [Ataeniobius toweri]